MRRAAQAGLLEDRRVEALREPVVGRREQIAGFGALALVTPEAGEAGGSAQFGYVRRFAVLSSFLTHYPVQQAGGSAHLECWIPPEDLAAFNAAIVGRIEVVAEFPQPET